MTYEISRWHHERYDGRGYPDGLKGDDIPIAVQAVSVADVYDALTQTLTSHRLHNFVGERQAVFVGMG